MRRYLKNQEHENMLKYIDFYHVRENVYKKTIIGYWTRWFQKGSP